MNSTEAVNWKTAAHFRTTFPRKEFAAFAVEIEFLQIIRVRHEALDQKAGGSFFVFSERETTSMYLTPWGAE
jgi:hypothetical protein